MHWTHLNNLHVEWISTESESFINHSVKIMTSYASPHAWKSVLNKKMEQKNGELNILMLVFGYIGFGWNSFLYENLESRD